MKKNGTMGCTSVCHKIIGKEKIFSGVLLIVLMMSSSDEMFLFWFTYLKVVHCKPDLVCVRIRTYCIQYTRHHFGDAQFVSSVCWGRGILERSHKRPDKFVISPSSHHFGCSSLKNHWRTKKVPLRSPCSSQAMLFSSPAVDQ